MEKSKSSGHKNLDTKWTKTQLVSFASCVKPKREGQRVTKQAFSRQKNKREKGNGSLAEICSCETDEADLEDDVFLWDLPQPSPEAVVHERVSEAMKLPSGRQKIMNLRTASEGVAVRVNSPAENFKIARSSSTSDARAAFSQPVAFSPRIVKKINLKDWSLKNWLGTDAHERKKEAKKAAYLHQNDVKSNNDDCYLLRRVSSEIVGRKLGIDERRRTSAPSTLNFEEEDIFNRNITQAKPSLVTCSKNDVKKFDTIHEFQIHNMIKEMLKAKLGTADFCADSCRTWCEQISEITKERIQLILLSTPCKVVCTIYIGAKRDHGIHTASQATLDCELDYHVSASYQNDSLFAVLSVFVVRYEAR